MAEFVGSQVGPLQELANPGNGLGSTARCTRVMQTANTSLSL